jgi:O-acetyl-ADP-ribose deacetylase (regulator of RNase III)
MITYIECGDIFKLPGITNYTHGCNCSGAMGKGIALQFRTKFPEMYREYKQLCGEGKFKLGDVFKYKYRDGYIFNLGTQKSWRTKAENRRDRAVLIKMLT